VIWEEVSQDIFSFVTIKVRKGTEVEIYMLLSAEG